MKIFLLLLFGWFVGTTLPLLPLVLQVLAGVLILSVLVVGVYYYIDTRINSIRI